MDPTILYIFLNLDLSNTEAMKVKIVIFNLKQNRTINKSKYVFKKIFIIVNCVFVFLIILKDFF